MLANGREAMVRRAIKSFQAQTYPNALLFIFDTTPERLPLDEYYCEGARVGHVWDDKGKYRGATIGTLRNVAAEISESDIIAHWDSDDWSHPNRLAEQVALLQAEETNGVRVVGYRDMLFWREDMATVNMRAQMAGAAGAFGVVESVGEAWLYQNVRKSYCIGTSLCYWRSAWKARPFADLPKPGVDARGEDDDWHKAHCSLGVWSIASKAAELAMGRPQGDEQTKEPRMIASIHGANSSYYGRDLLLNSPEWKRVPGWDSHCRSAMQL